MNLKTKIQKKIIAQILLSKIKQHLIQIIKYPRRFQIIEDTVEVYPYK